MLLRTTMFLLLGGLLSGCVSTGHQDPMKSAEGRDGARDAYIQLGIGYLQKGSTEQAKVPLKKALELDGSNADAHAALALVFQTEKQLKEYGDKIPADKKSVIEAAAEKLKEAHKQQDIAAIDASMTVLNNAWTAASQDIYNQQQQAGAQQPGADPGQQQQQGPGGNGNAENVQDVPFEEVK